MSQSDTLRNWLLRDRDYEKSKNTGKIVCVKSTIERERKRATVEKREESRDDHPHRHWRENSYFLLLLLSLLEKRVRERAQSRTRRKEIVCEQPSLKRRQKRE